MSRIRTRFAPSPTGFLHLGHAYAAQVAYELTRNLGGEALLRIEDLDTGRTRDAFEKAIYEDLEWLGLHFKEPLSKQSVRLPTFEAAIQRLTDLGLTYRCYCTRAETRRASGLGGAPHADDIENPFGPVYPGTCKNLTPSDRKEREAEGRPYALRLHMDRATTMARAKGPMQFFEALFGAPDWIDARPDPAGDIVLARKDLGVSYHIAVVVDDAAQEISHVTRGEDLFPSTHIHVLLQRLLRLPTPVYGHHVLVLDDTGKRLAKRDDARSIRTLREDGVSKNEVLARLPALPDWSRFELPTNR